MSPLAYLAPAEISAAIASSNCGADRNQGSVAEELLSSSPIVIVLLQGHSCRIRQGPADGRVDLRSGFRADLGCGCAYLGAVLRLGLPEQPVIFRRADRARVGLFGISALPNLATAFTRARIILKARL